MMTSMYVSYDMYDTSPADRVFCMQEDLTPESIKKVLDEMAAGREPKPGPQSGRRTVEPAGEAITLVGKPAGKEVFLAEWQ